MSARHPVSRRTSLKGLGVIGAAVAFGGAAQDKPVVNVVDLAADRFAKGHS